MLDIGSDLAGTSGAGVSDRGRSASAEPRSHGGPARDPLKAFAASGYGGLKRDYPGLSHRSTPSGVVWHLTTGRPIAGEGLPLKSSLRIETSCYEDASEILDAMAAANDATLRRRELDGLMREEIEFHEVRLAKAIEALHRRAERDLDGGFLDASYYLAHVDRFFSARVIQLYPAGTDEPGSRYRPSEHLKNIMKQACYEAQRAAFQERQRGFAEAKASRPIRTDAPGFQRVRNDRFAQPRKRTFVLG